MIDISKNEFTQIFCKRLDCLLFLVQPEISINMLRVILSLKHGLKVVEVNGIVSRRGKKPKTIF